MSLSAGVIWHYHIDTARGTLFTSLATVCKHQATLDDISWTCADLVALVFTKAGRLTDFSVVEGASAAEFRLGFRKEAVDSP